MIMMDNRGKLGVGNRRREALNEEVQNIDVSLPVSKNGKNIQIGKYFDAAKKLMTLYEEAQSKRKLDDAYVLGKRFLSFSLEEIPRHSEYFSKKIQKRRLQNRAFVEKVMLTLKTISETIDKEETEKDIRGKLQRSSGNRPLPQKIYSQKNLNVANEYTDTRPEHVSCMDRSGISRGLSFSSNGTDVSNASGGGSTQEHDTNIRGKLQRSSGNRPLPQKIYSQKNLNVANEYADTRPEHGSCMDRSGSSRDLSFSSNRSDVFNASGGGSPQEHDTNIRGKLQRSSGNRPPFPQKIYSEKNLNVANEYTDTRPEHGSCMDRSGSSRGSTLFSNGSDVSNANGGGSPQGGACRSGHTILRESGMSESFRKPAPPRLRRISQLKRDPPAGKATIVFTDIEGSTALWEANPNAMEKALKMHDAIMRKCCSEANGYEITTEGDAFQIAFHDPLDAIAFCIQVQIDLRMAHWSPALLWCEPAKLDRIKKFRGPRVRMGVHHGLVTSKIHEITHHVRYSGQTIMITKGTEGLSHGGQILVTIDAYCLASSMLDSIGSPQVLDLGEHVLASDSSEGEIAKRVVQIVPQSLAFDYFASRRSESGYGTKTMRGRQFPPPITKKQLSSSFLDAPYKNGLATIAFVYSPGLKKLNAELFDPAFTVLWTVVQSHLYLNSGYECQEDSGTWMLAFSSRESAVKFGLALLDAIERAPFHENINRSGLVQIGIHSGHFTSMGPHALTGRADYFGTVVNRAARVASSAKPGQVVVGMVGTMKTMPSISSTKNFFLELKQLKGVSREMSLFNCTQA